MHKYPAFWVVLPLALGIALSEVFLCNEEQIISLVGWPFVGIALFCLMIAVYVFVLRTHTRLSFYKGQRRFILGISFFFIILGVLLNVRMWSKDDVNWPEETTYYKGVLVQTPRKTQRSVQCDVLLQSYKTDSTLKTINTPIRLVLPRTQKSDNLEVGMGIAFHGKVERIRNSGNPDEFNYARYMRYIGFVGTALVWNSAWNSFTLAEYEKQTLPWLERLRIEALQIRNSWVKLYQASSLHSDALAIMTALTLGDRSMLTNEISELYSDTGATHLLALSGFNLGILMMLFNLFLLRCVRDSGWRWPITLSLMLLVWGYTFLTGLPSSLVRASTMCTFMLGAVLLRRQSITLNTLALAGGLMLVTNPYYLFDVGFQLSFMAMWGILALQPRLEGVLKVPYPWLRTLWKLFTVSLAAQICTAPIVMYVFHSLPIYASLLSLVLIPLTSVLVYGALLLSILQSLWSSLSDFAAQMLNLFVDVQTSVMRWGASLPYANIEGVYITLLHVLLAYLLIILWAQDKGRILRVRNGLTCLLLGMMIVCSAVVNRLDRVDDDVVFYNNRNCPAVHVIFSPESSYLLCANPDSITHLAYIEQTYWRRRLKSQPLLLPNDYKDSSVQNHNGLLLSPHVSVLMLCDNRWNVPKSEHKMPIDYLHICKGFKGSLHLISKAFQPKHVVLDASLTSYYRNKYTKETEEIGWEIYDMHELGALKIECK